MVKAAIFSWFGLSRSNAAIKERLKNEPRLRIVQRRCQGADPEKRLTQAVKDTRFVVIDTETTGYHAYANDRIVSIALLEMQGLALTENRYVSLVNPGRAIPPVSTAIHHITDADVAGAPLLEDLMIEISEFLGDSVLVGHHLNFDLRFINRELKRLLNCQLQNPGIDTMLLYLGYTGQIGHYLLEEVARACEVTITDRHTAKGDAIAAANIFSYLSKHMVKESDSVQELIKQQGMPRGF